MYAFPPRRYPQVRIGETADQWAQNWEAAHPGCGDLLPHRDLNNQIFLWSESCEGPPPKIAPPGRRIDPYGNLIHDEPPVASFTPPAPIAPPPSFIQANTVAAPSRGGFASYYGTPSQTPLPSSSIFTRIPDPASAQNLPQRVPSPITAPPSVPTIPSPLIPATPAAPLPPSPTSPAPPLQPSPAPAAPTNQPIPGQVFLPPYAIPVALPTPPVSVPIFPLPAIFPTPSTTAPVEAAPPTTTEQAPRNWWRELGITLLMLSPAILPLALLREKKRARA